MKRWGYIVLLLLAGMVGQGCSSGAIHEAEAVVAQADSLWQAGLMYGIDAGDSLSLAQAYETLKEHSVFSSQFSEVFPFVQRTSFLRTYARSCYHYGRLLRAKDHPAEAMQAFINAIHSRTRDYHILGRVYSNMGSICHLAGDFPLSYDMYEKSANCFLADNDSLSYYFLLNDMAYELAEQGKKEETLRLLNNISSNITDADIDVKIWETRAILYREVCQYDSTIYYARKVLDRYYSDAPMLLATAQAYYFLAQYDSALVYANKVLATSDFYGDLYNALYIISHEDSTLTKAEILQLTSQREDIRFEEYEPTKEQLSRAVRLLEADLDRKPDWRWLYAVIATVLIIGSCILLYVHKRRSQHKLLSQQVDDLSKINDSVKELHEHIKKEYTEYKDNLLTQIEQNYAVLTQSPNIFTDIHWKDYHALCQIINDNFGMLAAKLQGIYHLSEKEIRLCILVLLEITNSKQMAEMLYYSESGIRNFKNRTAKKIGTNSVKMRNALLKLAISEYSNAANNEIVHA